MSDHVDLRRIDLVGDGDQIDLSVGLKPMRVFIKLGRLGDDAAIIGTSFALPFGRGVLVGTGITIRMADICPAILMGVVPGGVLMGDFRAALIEHADPAQLRPDQRSPDPDNGDR